MRLIVATLAIVLAPLQSQAEFRGKGSIVGRILSESVAEAESPKAPTVIESKSGTVTGADETETEPPISRDALNALMKHPTMPDFDPLRPMSGRWVRCQDVVAAPASPAGIPCVKPGCKAMTEPLVIKSVQDRYSSSDRSHFSHTISQASDSECKTVVRQERSMYECSSADQKTLSCKITKREARTGSGAWEAIKLLGDENPIKLSFAGVEKKKKRAKPRDPRTLEAHIDGQTVMLDFEPAAARGHKTND